MTNGIDILPDIEWEFLRRRMRHGAVTLFLGAGFSDGATNRLRASPPLGKGLASLLASECAFEYHEEPLPTVYSLAQQRLGAQDLRGFLERHFLIEECAEWHTLLPTFVWRRIYTTNVDTVLEIAYHGHAQQTMRRIVCPTPPEERDQLLGELQTIYLHGCVAEPQSPLTFTFDDFAQQTVRPNSWYQRLVDDFFRTTILFIGTELHDSPFHHYVELRGYRDRGTREFRPKSYLISPDVTPIRKEQLSGSNIIGITSTAQEFFQQLRDRLSADDTSLDQIRTTVRPDLIITPSGPVSDPVLARQFYLIRPDALPKVAAGYPGQFFMGAEPTWSDIENEHDAEREITRTLLEHLLASPPPGCTMLHGPAGSGKSTTAMRLALRLASEGIAVWFAYALERLDLDPLLDKIHAEETQKEHYIVIDMATRHLGSLTAVINRIKNSPRVCLLLIDRTNAFARHQHALDELGPTDIKMPDLSNGDIINVIERIDHFGFLGALKSKSVAERFSEFKERAEKQLLVAMREATMGRGFDLILRDEYEGLEDQAQLAYLIACLVVSQGAPGVYSRHLRACLERSDYSKAMILNDLLRGILVSANQSGSLLKPRHKLIARWVCHEIASDDLKYNAIVRFLHAVSGDIVPNEIRRLSPAFLGYRGLVNSYGLKQLFASADRVLEVYDSVRDAYGDDFLFWLHFGMAQMDAGYFDIAENYLNQSLGLIEARHLDAFQPKHQLGILHLRIAANTDPAELGTERAGQGMEILRQQIRERGLEDSYPYAAYLQYVLAWYTHARSLITSKEWEELRSVGDRARQLYGLDDIVAEAVDNIERAYLRRVLPG